ncbi:cupin domain-containing protein [Thioalkalivibrio sp. ALgr1]|uniref:cupin domain-containing protein n=1 Tax=Thioalkalivibrio sp. ALgr1 TaxID=748655 RepID=UPI000381063A|nr:cupin domain-containing protein [Thioalkalivibrio sp. ALgr1]
MPAHDPNLGLRLLGGLSPAEFLRDYWQQKPLLVRGAVSDLANPIEPDDLAGLACEPDTGARLVLGDTDHGDWSVEYGPFAEDRFASLPDRAWTLLVSDVERFWPEGRDFLARFDFVPRWRRDDLMISYAAPEGSVGPHVDAYDVFLFQAAGRRRWQIQSPPGALECHDDLPLAILREFQPSESWDLEPGDLLYLPPNLPHYGLSLDDQCMTWSVGFRAPTYLDLLTGFLEERANRVGEAPRYGDPQRPVSAYASELPSHDRTRLRGILREMLAADDTELDAFLGRVLSRPAGNVELHPGDPLAAARACRIHPGIRRHWLKTPTGPVLCAAGHSYPADTLSPDQLEQLCATETLDPRHWEHQWPEIHEMLRDGLEEGWLEPAEDSTQT